MDRIIYIFVPFSFWRMYVWDHGLSGAFAAFQCSAWRGTEDTGGLRMFIICLKWHCHTCLAMQTSLWQLSYFLYNVRQQHLVENKQWENKFHTKKNRTRNMARLQFFSNIFSPKVTLSQTPEHQGVTRHNKSFVMVFFCVGFLSEQCL